MLSLVIADVFRYFTRVVVLSILSVFFQSCFSTLTTAIALTKIPNEDKGESFPYLV